MKNFELVFEWIQIGKRRNLLGLEYVHILKRLETRNCTRGGGCHRTALNADVLAV